MIPTVRDDAAQSDHSDAELTPIIRVPAVRLFWAVFDAPLLARSRSKRICALGPLPAGLLSNFTDQVPISTEELHAVGSFLPDGRVVACAMRKHELDAVNEHVMALVPESIPAELTADGLNPFSLNLLVGEFEPKSIRRARARKCAGAAGLLAALLAIVCIGSLRRTEHAKAVTKQRARATTALLKQAGPTGTTAMTLQTELDRLRQSASIDPTRLRPPDAAANLQKILGLWPRGTSARPQTITIGPDGASLAVIISEGEASTSPTGEFIKAIKAPDGWRLDEPSLASVGNQTRVNLRMRVPAFATEERRR